MRFFLIFAILFEVLVADFDKFNYPADVNGDGKSEFFRLVAFKNGEFGIYYQLKLYDSKGFLLWSGIKKTDSSNPFIFGEWEDGVSMPQAVVDIDGDGKDELVTPPPQGDVSPVVYRVLEYKKGKVVVKFEKILMLDKNSKDTFHWVKCCPDENSVHYRVWLMGIYATLNRREVVANIAFLDENGGSKEAKVVLEFRDGGAKIKRWISEFSSEYRGYLAKIGERDHFNSKGERLTKAIDILRQDRANCSKERGDKEDNYYGFFETLKSRERLSKMKIVPKNSSKGELEDSIIYGTPLLYIKPDKKRNSLTVEILKEF